MRPRRDRQDRTAGSVDAHEIVLPRDLAIRSPLDVVCLLAGRDGLAPSVTELPRPVAAGSSAVHGAYPSARPGACLTDTADRCPHLVRATTMADSIDSTGIRLAL